jgi:hypothetical protein
VNEEFENRPTKETVSSYLSKKANRSEVESLLSRKADLVDLKAIHAALECKTDVTFTESVVKELDNKPDRAEFLNILAAEIATKADNIDVEVATGRLAALRNELTEEIHTRIGESQDNRRALSNAMEDASKEVDARSK